MLVRAFEQLKVAPYGLPFRHEGRRNAARRIIEFYESIGKPNKANAYRKQLPVSDDATS